MHARLRANVLRLPVKPKAERTWGRLSAPVHPLETMARIRAQSILSGSLIGGGACPPLTYDQALDVLTWANERI